MAFVDLNKLIKKKKRPHSDFWVAQKCHVTLKEHLGRAGKFIAPSNFGNLVLKKFIAPLYMEMGVWEFMVIDIHG